MWEGGGHSNCCTTCRKRVPQWTATFTRTQAESGTRSTFRDTPIKARLLPPFSMMNCYFCLTHTHAKHPHTHTQTRRESNTNTRPLGSQRERGCADIHPQADSVPAAGAKAVSDTHTHTYIAARSVSADTHLSSRRRRWQRQRQQKKRQEKQVNSSRGQAERCGCCCCWCCSCSWQQLVAKHWKDTGSALCQHTNTHTQRDTHSRAV